MRRFGMDAAILFSDILLLPHALGQGLAFRDGEGPVLEPIADAAGIARLDAAGALSRLDPVLETVRRVRSTLGPQTALIGFAGAPWTVATYMVEGGTSRDFRRVKGWAYRDPQGFAALIELLVEATIELLSAQIAAGVEVVQLFDSWAGVLPEAGFARWVIEPTRAIVARAEAAASRMSGHRLSARRRRCCTSAMSPRPASMRSGSIRRCRRRSPATRLAPRVPVQGNLDPVLLLAGGAALEAAVSGAATVARRRAAGSSISAMACCPKRRPSMSRRSSVR